jgi:hypothetical protein
MANKENVDSSNRDNLLQEYRDYLQGLLDANSSEIFTNGGLQHASVLMSVLFENTKSGARVFSEGFKSELITTEPYWSILKKYVCDKTKSLNVLVENSNHLHEAPMQLLLEERARRSADDSPIHIRLIGEKDKEHIFRELKCEQCNFAVFDEKMYRFEYDPKKYKAFGSFNHEANCSYLIGLFDNAFDKAQELN